MLYEVITNNPFATSLPITITGTPEFDSDSLKNRPCSTFIGSISMNSSVEGFIRIELTVLSSYLTFSVITSYSIHYTKLYDNGKISFDLDNHTITSGINAEHQNNAIDGWGFIIPAYRQSNLGFFLYDKTRLGAKTILHTGIRYDYGTIKTERYFDWFTTPIA